MTEWKPIETAPTDGTTIKVRGWDFGIEGWQRHYAIATFKNGKWIDVDNNGYHLRYLTDWHDAPSPPPGIIDPVL